MCFLGGSAHMFTCTVGGKICFSLSQWDFPQHCHTHRSNKSVLQLILECSPSDLVIWLELVHIDVYKRHKNVRSEWGCDGWRMSRGRQTHNLKCHAVGITLSPALLALWGNKHTSTNERTVHPTMGRDIKMNLKSSMKSKKTEEREKMKTQRAKKKKEDKSSEMPTSRWRLLW